MTENSTNTKPTGAKEPAVKSQNPKEATLKQSAKDTGLCVYLGPNIRGVIQNGQIFSASRELVLKELAEGLKKHPQIAALIVSGGDMPNALSEVRAPGTLMNAQYNRLADSLKK